MTIIPAPAGFRLIRTIHGTLDRAGYSSAGSETVIAFAIDPAEVVNDLTPIPITPTGAPDSMSKWLLIHPDGNLSSGEERFESLAEWKADRGLDR